MAENMTTAKKREIESQIEDYYYAGLMSFPGGSFVGIDNNDYMYSIRLFPGGAIIYYFTANNQYCYIIVHNQNN
jgi:hypothetical protein